MEPDSRFQQGAILYFDPFIFPDGGKPKPKYFLVLKRMDDALLLASLPTSKDHVPEFIEKQHGCIERPAISFSCYYFDPSVPIYDNGFSFHMEYQKNEVSEDEVEKLYFYLCRTLFYGMEDPNRTIGEIIDWI